MNIKEIEKSTVTTDSVTVEISDDEIQKYITTLLISKYPGYAVAFYDENIRQDCFNGVNVKLEKTIIVDDTQYEK